MSPWLVLLVALGSTALLEMGVGAQRFYSGGSPAAAAAPCTTPEGGVGQCVLLQECDHLFEQYRLSRHSPETRSYLRKFVCDQRDRYSKFCCSNNQVNGPPIERLTPKPATRGTRRPPTRGDQRLKPTNKPATMSQESMKLVQEPNFSEGNLRQHKNINLVPSIQDCGQDFVNKIYGGNQTSLGEFPWAALLEYEKDGVRSFQCGGALISKRYVITAAHCSSKGTIGTNKLVGVRLGEYDINSNPDCESDEGCRNCPDVCADPKMDFNIEEEIVHPEYRGSSRNQHNDIALLRLDADAPSTDYIRPICFPTDESLARKSYAGITLTATGWGRATSGMKSPVKLKATLPSISNDECAALYAKSRRNVTSLQMCAGGVEGVDVCGGDSGGPLMSGEAVGKVVRYHVTGIVSYGSSFCHHGTPGVYTRVASYARWVLDQLRP